MKNHLFLIILCLTFTFASCKKENRAENKLEGTWELRNLVGFLPPELRGDRPPGNGDIYKFQGSNFERLMSGKITDTGTFSVVKEKTNYNEELEFKLVLDGIKRDDYIPFKLSKGKLILHFGSLASDGAIGTYGKLQAAN